jgi:hypothetical protein
VTQSEPNVRNWADLAFELYLDLDIQAQPTDASCGPTCLAAVYKYWDDPADLQSVIQEIGQLRTGGTLAVQLACHALRRGYNALITTYNLQVFDPTWFRQQPEPEFLARKLTDQLERKRLRTDIDAQRLGQATRSYLEFLSLGGKLQMQPLDGDLIAAMLSQNTPILCGLSATYLYQEARERPLAAEVAGRTSCPDDVGGDPSGHFVVLHGYDRGSGLVMIADPLHQNPIAQTSNYTAPLTQVIDAILLGIVTYDANLLTLSPSFHRKVNH